MIEAIFGFEFFHVKHVIDVQFCYPFVPAERKCLRGYIFNNVVFFMEILDDIKKLDANHACILESHLTTWTIAFESIKNSDSEFFKDKYQAIKVLPTPEVKNKNTKS